MNKNVFVIEDSEDSYDELKTFLARNNYSVFPENKKGMKKLRSCIKKIYDNRETAKKIKDSRKFINEKLSCNIDCFIIDYELDLNNTGCTGLKFYDDFIKNNDNLKNKTVIFITGVKDYDIEQKIIDHIGNNSRSKVRPSSLRTKLEDKDRYFEDLRKLINSNSDITPEIEIELEKLK